MSIPVCPYRPGYPRGPGRPVGLGGPGGPTGSAPLKISARFSLTLGAGCYRLLRRILILKVPHIGKIMVDLDLGRNTNCESKGCPLANDLAGKWLFDN